MGILRNILQPNADRAAARELMHDLRLGHQELRNQLQSVAKTMAVQNGSLTVPTATQAEKCGPYAACVNIIARVASKLTLKLVDDDGAPVESALSEALLKLWNGTALGPARLLAWIVNRLFYDGNAYLYINTRDERGNETGGPYSLMPVTATPVFRGLVLTGYRINVPNGGSKLVRIDEILHFTTERTNGVLGIPPREKEAADEVALYIQLTRFANTSFDDDMMARLALIDKLDQLGEKGIRALEKQFSRKYTGTKSRRMPMVIPGEMDLKELQYDLRKSQLGDIRKQVALLIVQAMGVPPTLVGMDTTQRVYGAGIREIVRSFYSLRMVALFDIIGQELTRKLLPVDAGIRAQFDATSIVELDREELAEIHSKEVKGATRTQDEARAELGLEPKGGTAEELSGTATATINMGASNA